MARVSFNKLGLKINQELKTIQFTKDTVIEIKQYLPIETKMELISNVLNNTVDENRFYNPGLLDMNLTLQIVMYYTNINFTDKQKENSPKLYDIIMSNKLYSKIEEHIPEEELDFIFTTTEDVITSLYQYNNSIYGVLDALNNDYDNLNFDAEEIMKKLSNGENVEFLRDVMDKLG